MSSVTQWYRVAKGLQLVARAAQKQTLEHGGEASEAMARHGVDLVKNVQKAAAAAGVQLPQNIIVPPATQMSTQRGFAPQQGQTRTEFENIPMNALNKKLTNDAPTKSIMKEPSQPVEMPQSVELYAARIEVTSAEEGVGEQTHAENLTATAENSEQSPFLSSATKHDGKSPEIGTLKNTGDEHDPIWNEMNTQPTIKEGRAVPSSRFGRALGFASLGFGLAAGSVREAASRFVGGNQESNADNNDFERNGNNKNKSYVGSDANAMRLASSLSRLRGAALKLGQMLSIQDETLLPPTLAKALRQVVHQGAESMPSHQLRKQLTSELGEDWREKFVTFDENPIAAASIGQVHKASILDESAEEGVRDVVVKVQYPGVADSIESDLANLNMIVKATGLAPKGLFIDEIIRVGRTEVVAECDYLREMSNYKRFKSQVDSDAYFQQQRFVVPDVVETLCTKQILTTGYAPGGTIDKVHLLSQEERNRVGRVIMNLTLKELFQWRFMQTDPK
jgi:hypothetical protein